jgi:hypothetical protein
VVLTVLTFKTKKKKWTISPSLAVTQSVRGRHLNTPSQAIPQQIVIERRDNDNGDVRTSYERRKRRRNVLAREIIRAVEAIE